MSRTPWHLCVAAWVALTGSAFAQTSFNAPPKKAFDPELFSKVDKSRGPSSLGGTSTSFED